MYYFIINPRSRSGLGIQIWKQIQTELENCHTNYRAAHTTHSGHAEELARKLSQDSMPKTIVVLGGDGTLNEVINGLEQLSTITLGYIPTGSSNDFARSMSLPTEPVKALNNILHPASIVPVEYGVVEYNGSTRRFLVSSGIGFDAAICQKAMDSKLKKILNRIRLGKMTYILIGLQMILTHPTTMAYLKLDEQEEISLPRFFFTSCHIQPYEGGGLKFCPSASPSDGLLDLCIMQIRSRLPVPFMIPAASKGKHVSFKEVLIHQCRRAAIRTTLPMAVHTDGEGLEHTTEIIWRNSTEQISLISG